MPSIPCTEARAFVRFDNDADRFLPEGPHVIPAGTGHYPGSLVWVNIQTAADSRRGAINWWSWDETKLTTFGQPFRPGFVLPTDQPSTLFVGADKAVGPLFLMARDMDRLATIADDSPRTMINDGNVVPGGKAVVFGTKDTQFKEPIAHLYLYTVDDNRLSVLADGQLCSNGKVFGTDARGLILYDIDTPTRKIARYRLDVAARTATPDGTAVDVSGFPGFPDGMCDCGDGTAIVAFYNPEPVPAGKAIRFDLRTGEPIEEWTTPGSPRVTCPCLVQRPDGVKLILTTATEVMPAELRAKCPEAGNLFIADTAFTSCPMPEVVRLPG